MNYFYIRPTFPAALPSRTMPNLSPPDLPPLAAEDGVDEALAAALPDVSESQSFIAICRFFCLFPF